MKTSEQDSISFIMIILFFYFFLRLFTEKRILMIVRWIKYGYYTTLFYDDDHEDGEGT